AVPTAVLELFAGETAHQALRWTPEVGAERERAAVDARLHFALEERLRAKRLVPPEAGLEARDRRRDAGAGGADPRRAQQLQREKGWQPVRRAGAVPRAILSLTGEDCGADAFVRHAGALRGDRRRKRIRQIAHRLPAYGRI